MRKSSLHIIFAAVLSLCAAVVGCAHSFEADTALDAADALIESRPDSALAILSAIDPASLAGESRAARYALLMSMALDKNYIDTSDFAVIQPAIDYYLDNGTPDERLRTLYYTGVIHKNRGERNEAMSCFMDAAELRNEVTDSLVLARNFVMQGMYYFDQYRIGSATDKYLQAAELLLSKRPDLAMDSYIRALHGAILKEDQSRADSIMSICESMISSFPESNNAYDTQRLSYQIEFGSDADILDVLSHLRQSGYNDWMHFALVRTYIRLGDGAQALYYLNLIDSESTEIGVVQYSLTKAEVLYLAEDFRGAADAYALYIEKSGLEIAGLLNSGLPYSGKRHELKMQQESEIRDRNRMILLFGLIASLLALICLAISFGLYRQRAKRIISEQTNRNLELELETKSREKEKAEIDKQAATLEVENLRLQNAANDLLLSNLRLEKSRLENERESLRELLSEKSNIDESVRGVIRERLSLLNSVIANGIANSHTLGAPYQQFINQIHSDKKRFLKSTRLAFTVSHPQFIQYLEACGLTEDEIYLCCLYAIGLRGKEVGEYTGLKRHYTISSDIRKKLGLSEHQTNLNKYIQSLLDGKIPPVSPIS